MTSIETLDFNNDDGGMVNLPQTDRVSNDDTYEAQREISDNNNIDDNQSEMDLATPLSEVMGEPEQPHQMMMMQAPSANTMMPPQAPPQVAPQQQQAKAAPNPGNLTDEQLDALLVSAAAMLAFSAPVREKMLQYTPQLFTEGGARTLAGGIATGIVAGSVFYGVKRFVLNK